MIFSNEHRFIFIHNPKAAGTSVRAALEHLHDFKMKFWHQMWSKAEHRVIDRAHLTAGQWAINDQDGDSTEHQFFKFGFVRNPYDRFWSAAKEFDRRHGDHLRLTPENIELLLTPANIAHDWRFIHFCPQHMFFYRLGKCIADFIGRYEHLEQSWDHIVGQLGNAGISHRLSHERKSPEADPEWLRQLKASSDVWHHIGKLYQQDFATFGYEMKYVPLYQDTHADRVEVLHNPLCRPLLDQYLERSGPLKFTFSSGERKELEKYEAATEGFR